MLLMTLVASVLSISLTSTQAAGESSNDLIESVDTERSNPNLNAHQQTDPVTLVISEVVKPDRIQEYEDWQKGIHEVLKGFAGFRGVDVIRPSNQTHPEYVTIIKFDTYDHLRQWQQSPEFQEWIPKSKDLLVGDAHLQHASGLELWFTFPDNELRRAKQPAYYKMIIIGTLVVYSLILIVKLLFGRLLDKLPFLLSLFISVLIVSGLMTYPVLPWVTGLLDFWLFPLPDGKG